MKKMTLGVLVLLLWGCEQKRSSTFSGTLELTEHSLGARAAGRLETLHVADGDEVKKGRLLATLDRHDKAERDHARTLALFRNGGATRQALEEAELTLRDQRIVSPVDGVVLLKVHEPGEILSAGSTVIVVGDRSRLWVRIYIPEGLINRVRVGQEAAVRLDGLKETFKGRVIFISPTAEYTPRNVQTAEERVTQTFAVKVAIDNPPVHLRPGVAADVSLDLKG